MASLVGRTLGNYQITDLLGQGGMATVYKGYREDIDRYVAVKVLPPHPGLDAQFVDRFKLEARTIARLQHPHILPLYDYGAEDDILYLVMAYVEGGSLADRIERGVLSLREIETLLRQMASALDYAHRQGVIHRDIKPDNILLDKEGHALLADFGIVKLTSGGSGGRLTVTGGLVGTPAYMAPEQGRGEEITSSADIYSLGVVVYEMLTGRQPYSAETPMQVVIKHMNEPIPSVRDRNEALPAALEMVIQRVLAKDQNNRYVSAAEFADDFTRAVHTHESVAGMQIDFKPAPDPTMAAPQGADTLTPASANPTPTQIIVQQQGINPLLLLGGFAIIAVLIVAVVVLLTSDRGAEVSIATTATSVEAEATDRATTQIASAPSATPQPTFGRLSFSTTNVLGDTVTLQVANMRPPASGEIYVAWLTSSANDSALTLGTLTLDALGSGVLPPFVDAAGRTLPTIFNNLTITREQGVTDEPSGPVVYAASVPVELSTALGQIFLTSPDGLGVDQISSSDYQGPPSSGGPTVGLLYSALAEAKKASQHAGLAQRSSNVGGMRTHAEHTINILLGNTDDLNGDGRGENPGFSIGIPHFLDLMEAQLDAAANAPDSTIRLQSDLELIRVCLVNTRSRIEQIIAIEQAMLEAESIEAVAQQALEATRLANRIINGFDFNGNEQIEPFEEECGLMQIETYGLLTGNLNLFEAAEAS